MMSGANSDAVLIQEAADVIGMVFAQIKGDHPCAIRRTIDLQRRYLLQRFERIMHQRMLIISNRLQPQRVHVVNRRPQSHHACSIGGTGFKTPRWLGIGGAESQAHLLNH
ncbi:hypothetical protein D3C72_1635090 [compost metagenome]